MVRTNVDAVCSTDTVDEQVQRPRRGHLRIQLPQGARSRISRVGERGLSRRRSLPIDRFEDTHRQVCLSARLQQGLWPVHAQPERQALDRFEVGRDLLALEAVTARSPPGERAIFVRQRYRGAVDFEFADILYALLAQGR